MLSLKQKQSGFTIVELLIVIVIIGILAGLVITTFAGIQARARDSERQTDINAIQKQLEAYYANYGGYPSLADLNNTAPNTTFRAGNNLKLDDKALADPSNSTQQTLVGTITPKRYAYVPAGAAASCESPTLASGASSGSTNPCTSYTLTAVKEADGTNYQQKSQ